ncbi:MAG: Crp/Fnr family transcriptional regulator [Bacteroidota bacterium]|nr:Crp/Fnr family transcriptional regulator [Bacteroidota bacterium]MDX5405187.1 Crp/Fnr family transcriptional regulator [Bacteroidota bacterium]MDX5427039.1 Crp/Fnr family transcriptional regulator [Bacteroidota bacterium]MDX5447499.1 Crp/Fnr family transcriptional regulator [Bacteroidota bacterium]MDX5505016.1 Crp/Fnr family transcriptional regulator [Bacteroidota bacterium]
MLDLDLLHRRFPQFTNEDLINDIAQEGHLYEYEAGDIIIDTGVPIPFVPLLLEGSMRIIRRDDEGHEILLYYIDEGQSCATSLTCCMNKQVSEVEAIAEEPVVLIGVPAARLDEWMDKYPEWKRFVMNTYRIRFEELLNTVNSIAFSQLDDRLVKYLLERSRIQGKNTIRTSHQEIANDLNSSREVISRLLKQLERQGSIKLSRNAIEIIDL